MKITFPLSSLLFCMTSVLVSATYAQTVRVSLKDASNEPVVGAVVEILLPTELKSRYAIPEDKLVDQVDKEFLPSVSSLVVGSHISFPNYDDILHHVYSFSPVKTFNIPLYGTSESDNYRESFETSGVVEIGCNIHDWMLAYIYVAESSKVAVTDEQGMAEISDLPAGDYQLKIWHSRLVRGQDALLQPLELRVDSISEVNLIMELQRERRVRRAPSANRKRYRYR